MSEVHPIIALAERYLRDEVGPKANLIDSDTTELGAALDGLCERGLMALKRPQEYGGPALDEASFRSFQESVARYSGTLAFLQTQHQSAVNMLVRSDNEALKEKLLPGMHDGTTLVGIGFSQLRRPGPPMMRAEKIDGGYRLDGQVPWITGFSYFDNFLIGATLPEGQAVFAVVPFLPVQGIEFSEPMKLAAMEAAQTVSGEFSGFVVSDDDVAFVKPGEWIHNNDMINITLQGFFAVGCARAGLDIVKSVAEKRKAQFIEDAYQALDKELIECRTKLFDASAPAEERLSVRAWAIDLAVRCAHAGVTCSSGAANSMANNAQRVYREALVYTVSAQTAPIMEATLQRLIR